MASLEEMAGNKVQEVKSAKKRVESAIKMFGPPNVTSILDRDTYKEKLDSITNKLEACIEKADKITEELQKLENKKVDHFCDEIDSLIEEIINKVNNNEYEVKKKIEKIIKEYKENKDTKSRSNISEDSSSTNASQNPAENLEDNSNLREETLHVNVSHSPTNQITRKMSTEENIKIPTELPVRIEDYCETGPFLSHLPQFVFAVNYVMKQYQKKLPLFGHLLKPDLVGGLVDKTGGTLTAPDLDVNIEWELDEAVVAHLDIRPTDQGESGQYTLQIREGYENEFKTQFERFVVDIQNHGRPDMAGFVHHKVNDVYVEKDSTTFVSSDLLRNQVEGLFELLKEGKSFGDFIQKDFSRTGAARTMALDVHKFFKECLLTCLIQIPDNFLPIFNGFVSESCYKILPELEVDYTPVLTIPYSQLPPDLNLWEHRHSWLLDHHTKEKIKEAKGTLVAKSLEKDENRASIIWRLSLNSAPVMQKLVDHFQNLEPKCNVRKVLRIIKDIKNVALEGSDRDFLKSYNVKQAMLWCAHENPAISTEPCLLMSTLNKIVHFYQEKSLPSFLEPKRNLIFKMSKNNQLEVAEKKVSEILHNVSLHMDRIKEVQAKNRKGVAEVRSLLSPMAPILLFPVVSDRILEKTIWGINKDFVNKDGILRFYFEDSEMVEVLDKATKAIKMVSEKEALRLVIKNLVDAILTYVTKNEGENEDIIEKDSAEEDIPCGIVTTTHLADSIADAFGSNEKKREKIKEVAAILVPAIAKIDPYTPPVVNQVVNIFKLFKKK